MPAKLFKTASKMIFAPHIQISFSHDTFYPFLSINFKSLPPLLFHSTVLESIIFT